MTDQNDPNYYPGVAMEEMFVFGYQCKVFRDDEKAIWIQEGQHLIPWMGDPSILIDRYDGRGALMDLRSHESPRDPPILTPDELEMERVCDRERFRDFREDQELDDVQNQEEEFRRLQMAVNEMSDGAAVNVPGYAAIQYSYNDNKEEAPRIGPEPKKVKDNNPYVKPPGLFPPSDVVLPKTMKSHAIIEKTAKFIASQDGQMEIILKTKQSNNPQFEFLNFSHPLNPYYKFLVTAIQTFAYQPSEEMPTSPDDSPSRDSGSDDGSESSESYLHPSLAQNNTPMSTLISQSMYKPSTVNSAYSMLVSKIKEVTTVSQSPPVSPYPAFGQGNTGSGMQYGIGNENHTSSPSHPPNMPYPNPQEQVIIDKMANYVVKNGPAFESLANHKGDSRFMFLDPAHPFHWYYLSCKERYQVEAGAVVVSRQFVGYNENSPKAVHSSSAVSTSSETATKAAESTVTSSPSTAIPTVTVKYTKPTTPSMPAPNHANALNRMASLPPELISKIEELRRKTLLNRMKNAAAGGVPKTLSVSPSPDSNDLVTSTSASIPQVKLKREQVIKFSSSLSQRILGAEPEVDPLESMLSSSNGNGSEESGADKSPTQDSEEVRRRKAERRKKAALFLQQLKLKKMTADSQTAQPGTEKIQDEKENQESDVESIPSPIARKTEGADSTSSRVNLPDSTLHETSIGQFDPDLKATKDEVEILEIFKESNSREEMPTEEVESSEAESKRKHRKRIRKSSISRSPTVSSISDSEQYVSSSHRKKSKKKHSKKTKRKHEKSHSHSKKSRRDKDKYEYDS